MDNIRAAFNGDLLEGEQIVWAGEPERGLKLRPRDLYLVPFALVWCGFAFSWFAYALFSDWGGVTPYSEVRAVVALFSLPFLAIGLMVAVGRFVVDAAVRRKTVYAVTNRRILIKSGLRRSTLTSKALANVDETSVALHGGGPSGTITFARTNPLIQWDLWWHYPWVPSLERTRIEFIPDATNVHKLILAQQNAAR